MQIQVTRAPDAQRLNELGVYDWPIWEKEASSFPWHYDARETCYLLAGDVVVTPDGGEPVHIQAGDLVSFPAGMDCTWQIRAAVRKHYRFE
ncbi:MAG: cupin [Gammaproteobacteria bacterium]|nr:cupin [Gammaproteobacteria bacterium]